MGNVLINPRQLMLNEVVPIEVFAKIGDNVEIAVTLKVKRLESLRDIKNKYKDIMSLPEEHLVEFYVMDQLLTENDTPLMLQINETDRIQAVIDFMCVFED